MIHVGWKKNNYNYAINKMHTIRLEKQRSSCSVRRILHSSGLITWKFSQYGVDQYIIMLFLSIKIKPSYFFFKVQKLLYAAV